jgi:hypothetical protein
MPGLDVVVGHHLNPFTSGVARFNEILARRTGTRVIGIFDEALAGFSAPLFSFKTSELSSEETAKLDEIASELLPSKRVSLFLHEYSGDSAEAALIRAAEVVYCGNDAVYARVDALGAQARLAWAPGLVLDTRSFEPAELTVFSFGMAHKIRTDKFRRLRDLLEASGRSYAIYISNANHESATFEDAQSVFEDMGAVFERGLYFMGNLSDVAVFNHLLRATYFAAFFTDGVRANNTSVASAMEHGCVVITNLDEYSPKAFVHMENVIDINRCEQLPADPLVLKRIAVAAMETARELSWERLVETVAP